jgi:transcriptional regulator with XRE-family HTH domain
MTQMLSLRKYRQARGLDYVEVAELMGLEDYRLISLWESGLCLPDLEQAFDLAKIYHVTVEELFAELVAEVREEIARRKEDEEKEQKRSLKGHDE